MDVDESRPDDDSPHNSNAGAAQSSHEEVVDVIPRAAKGANLTPKQYERLYSQSIKDPKKFWSKQASDLLHWDTGFHTVQSGSFLGGDVAWFLGGTLNASVQCLDRHLEARGDQTAIIWEADEPGQGKSYTYREVLQEVSRIANVMKAHGVRKGDPVTLYMPMMPATAFVMLACARIGAPHSVVFAALAQTRCATASWTCTASGCSPRTRACAGARKSR